MAENTANKKSVYDHAVLPLYAISRVFIRLAEHEETLPDDAITGLYYITEDCFEMLQNFPGWNVTTDPENAKK